MMYPKNQRQRKLYKPAFDTGIPSTENANWMPIIGYEGNYYVSDTGRVRTKNGKILAFSIDGKSTGYVYVNLSKNGVVKKKQVHILVLESFVGPRPSIKHEAAHNDGIRSNPRLSNLRWATPAENMADKHLHGTAQIGEISKSSKLTSEFVKWIYESNQSSIALSHVFCVASSTIRAIRAGVNWKHIEQQTKLKRAQSPK